MPSRFASRTLTLGELFSDPNELRVPDYQRPYSWTVTEAVQLLDDISIAIIEEAETENPEDGYFLGSVLLIAEDEQKTNSGAQGRQVFDIVDGQQRLVTATILLAVIREIAEDRGLPLGRLIEPLIWIKTDSRLEPRLKPRYGEARFMRTFIQDPGASALMPDADELTQSQSRLLDVREQLAETIIGYTDDDLAILARYLTSACFLSVITTNSLDRAHRIFTVLNNRGRPLTRNDILKAQILGAIPHAQRPADTLTWDGIEGRLGPSFEGLFSHIRAAEGHGKGHIIRSIGGLIAAHGGAKEFFDNILAPYAGIYETILSRGRHTYPTHPAIGRYLTYLNWLSGEDWVPPLMLFWRQCNGDPARIEPFLRALDRYSYGLRLLGIGTDKRLTRLNGVLESIRRGTVLSPGDQSLEFSREDLRNIQFNLRSLHTRSQQTCKLILLRLSALGGDAVETLNPADFTVEHVLPQKPGRNSDWRAWFSSAEEREECTQSLGNLVLISRDDNERAKNMELQKKFEIYFPDTGRPPLAITEELKGLTEWRVSDVKRREERFLATLNQMWSLTPPKTSPQAEVAAPARRRRTRRIAG